ncbi:MAG: TlpA disulfide reductase family protein [Thermodesulfobacteriota bacterium]|nr:TlpA disulfide reductase family protein [Thermodesulfobacteriota bacterium]
MKLFRFIILIPLVLFSAINVNADSSSDSRLIKIEKKLQLDYELPYLSINDVNNKYLLKELNEMTIINFWSSWCGPCVDEVKHLNKFQKLIEDNNLNIKIIAINIFDDLTSAKDFVIKYKPNFLLLFDDSKMIPIDFAVSGVPETYFIKENSIKFKYVGKITNEKLIEGYEKLKSIK